MAARRITRSFRRTAGLGVLTAALLVVALVLGATSPRADAAPQGLLVSSSSDRSSPVYLSGSVLRANAYIFVSGYGQARRVTFRLDARPAVTRYAPFDYAGTARSGKANPLDTTGLADGTHTLSATVLRRDGSRIARLVANFTVNNQPAAPPPPSGSGSAGGAGGILVPAYFYPGESWTRMCSTLSAGSIASANPSSGPGTDANPDYAGAISDCRTRGVGVVGYVYTSYGARAMSAVKADVDAYFSRYSVSGIFFDEASNDSATQAYYASLYQYVHAKSAGPLTVVTNPGAAAETAWQLDGGTSDVVTVFEGTPTQFAAWTPPAWIAGRSATSLASIVYAAGSAAMQSTCTRAKSLNIGWTYVTPDVLPNPFDTLPTDPYWSSELSACG
jgi:hypothetical protein